MTSRRMKAESSIGRSERRAEPLSDGQELVHSNQLDICGPLKSVMMRIWALADQNYACGAKAVRLDDVLLGAGARQDTRAFLITSIEHVCA